MNKIATLPSNLKTTIGYVIASMIVLYFIFSPAINILYYVADDFRYAFGGFEKTCAADDGFFFVLTLGRPIQAYMDCLSFKFAYSLERMQILRLLSVALLGCAMGLFATWLTRLGFSILTAFFAAGTLFLMQQLYSAVVAMGTTPLPFAILLCLLAYQAMQKAYCYQDHHEAKKKVRRSFVLAGFCLLAALLTYPAMAFFFVTLILTKLLFSPLSEWTRTRREVILESLLFCGVCALYFVWGFYNMHFHAQAPIPDSYRLDRPNLNFHEIENRINIIINVFSKLWTVLPSGHGVQQAWFMIIALSGGSLISLITYFRSSFYKHNPANALIILSQALLVTCCVFLLGSSLIIAIPNTDIVFGEHWLFFSVVSLGFAFIFWGIYSFCHILPNTLRNTSFCIVMGSLFLLEGSQANIVTMARAVTFHHTLSTHIDAFSKHLSQGNKLRHIHYIIPKTSYPYDRFFVTNGALVQLLKQGKYDLRWCSLPRGVSGNEKDFQKEALACINNLPSNGIAVTYSYVDEPHVTTPTMLLMDERPLDPVSYFHDYLASYYNLSGWNYF